MRRSWSALAACVVAAMACHAAAVSAQDTAPKLITNEAELSELVRPSSLTVDDPLSVFGFVLSRLPERVHVLPTENYYYFRFVHGGIVYDGNILLSASERDQGRISFAYGELPWDQGRDPKVHHMLLGEAQGVRVEKIDVLVYRITFRGRSVIFTLNDLRGHKPPAGLLTPNERLLGPVFDESGIRFFLVFNPGVRVFHFLLDETEGVADQFFRSKVSDRIVIGKRTGFAFYEDGGRKILVGVRERDSRLNTYYDGPFDQLPENFIEGEELQDAILSVVPGLKGRIDRLGKFIGRPGRFLIHPYLLYRSEQDLAVFQRCATDRRVSALERPACFVIPDDEQERRNPLPLALLKR